MTETDIKKQRKWLYWLMAALMFALILWMTSVIMRCLLASNDWVNLVHDVDHRMKRPQFTDINSDGIRSPREASEIKPDDFNIVFLGDSFVHGFILQYKLAPPKQLEEIARAHFNTDKINVWNFGWTSSSPILDYRLLKDLGKKYHPDLVILSVDMTDYKDDYFYQHIIEGDGVYKWVNQYPRSMYIYKNMLEKVDQYTDWHKQMFGYSGQGGYFVAMQPLEQNRYLFDELYNSLNLINNYCRDELNVPFVVFIPPRHWQYTDKESPHTWDPGFEALGPYALENYRYFDEKRPTTPYPLISLLDDFKNSKVFPTTFDVDSHWNKHGAHLAAESIFNHVVALGYLSELHATTTEDRRH